MTLCLRTVANQIMVKGQRRLLTAAPPAPSPAPSSPATAPGAERAGRRCSRAAQQGGSSQGAPRDPTVQSRDKNHGMQIQTDLLIPKESHLGFCLAHLSPPTFSLPQANSALCDAQRFAGLSLGSFTPNPLLTAHALLQSGSHNTQGQTTRHIDFCKSGSKTK